MNLQLLNTAEELAFYSEEFAPGSSEAIDKAVSFGLPFSLYGFAVVFSVLAIIMLVVIVFGKIFGAKTQKPKAEPKQSQNKPEPKVEAPAPVVAAAPAVDNGKVVAAIMAAVSAFRGANGESGAFRVVSFKKRK